MGGNQHDTALRYLAVSYLATHLVHIADHVRQGRSLGPGITIVGAVGLVSAVVLLAMAWRHDRLAPLAAVALGISAPVGLLAFHVAPNWSYFSDSYLPLQLDALSWLVIAVQATAGLSLALVAASMMRSAYGRTAIS